MHSSKMSGHNLLAITIWKINNIIWFRVFNDCGTKHGDFVLIREVMEVCRALGNLYANCRNCMQKLGKALRGWNVRAALVRVAEMLTSTQLTTVQSSRIGVRTVWNVKAVHKGAKKVRHKQSYPNVFLWLQNGAEKQMCACVRGCVSERKQES